MRQCKDCGKFTQSVPCNYCGYDERGAKEEDSFNQDDHKLRQKLNGCLAAIARFNNLLLSHPENSHIKNMLLILKTEKKSLERDIGSSIYGACLAPENLRCSYHDCKNTGTMASLGMGWYCRDHFQN